MSPWGILFFGAFKRLNFSRGPWQIWEVLQLLKLYFLKVCCIIPKNGCFWQGYRTERLFQFFVQGWVLFVHGWVLFVQLVKSLAKVKFYFNLKETLCRRLFDLVDPWINKTQIKYVSQMPLFVTILNYLSLFYLICGRNYSCGVISILKA